MIRKRAKLKEERQRKAVVLKPNDVAGGEETQRFSSIGTVPEREETKVNSLPTPRFQPAIKPVPKAALREQEPRSRAPLPRKQAPSKAGQPRRNVAVRRDAGASAAPSGIARSSQEQVARSPAPPRPAAKAQPERSKESWSDKMTAPPWRKNESSASRGDVGGVERSYDASASDSRSKRRLGEGTTASARTSRGEAADPAQPRGQVASARPVRRPRPVFGQPTRLVEATTATLKSSTAAASSTRQRVPSVRPAEANNSSLRPSARDAGTRTLPRQHMARGSSQRSLSSPPAKGRHPDRR